MSAADGTTCEPILVKSVLPPAAAQTTLEFELSQVRTCPSEGVSWPILVTSPEASIVIAAVPPASLIDPPSSRIISPSTVRFRIALRSLLASTTRAFEAVTVPAVTPSSTLISEAVAVTPSRIFNSAAVAVTPSRIFNSAAVAVTPSRIFNSAAVAVTNVPPRWRPESEPLWPITSTLTLLLSPEIPSTANPALRIEGDAPIWTLPTSAPFVVSDIKPLIDEYIVLLPALSSPSNCINPSQSLLAGLALSPRNVNLGPRVPALSPSNTKLGS